MVKVLDIYRNYLAFASDTEAHMVYWDINMHRRDDTEKEERVVRLAVNAGDIPPMILCPSTAGKNCISARMPQHGCL